MTPLRRQKPDRDIFFTLLTRYRVGTVNTATARKRINTCTGERHGKRNLLGEEKWKAAVIELTVL